MRYALICGVAVLAIAGWLRLSWAPAHPIYASGQTSSAPVDCTRFGGNDAGQKIQACLDSLPSGGIADARCLTGPQTISQPLRLTHVGAVLELGAPVTFTFVDGATLDIAATNVRIDGQGNSTRFLLGDSSAVRIGSPGKPIWGWRLESLDIEPAPGKKPLAGLLLTEAREGIIEQLRITGFPGSAIDIGDNSWSDRSIDTQVASNDIGYNFHGDKISAWNIRGGIINSNRIGLNISIGHGLMQGISITDGTQMEGDKDCAIRLGSGEIRGLFLSDIYSELFASERLIKVDPEASPLQLHLLAITNGFIYAKDTPPVYLTTRPQDIANAVISNITLRHSQNTLPIAEISGPHTSAVVSGSFSYSSTNEAAKVLLVSRDGARATTVSEGAVTH